MLGPLSPNLLDLGVMMAFWPAVMRRGSGWRRGRYWLREGEGGGSAEQFEGPGLDRGGGGELLDFLPGEADDLPGEGGQVAEQVLVAGDGQPGGVCLAASLALAWSDRCAGATGSAGAPVPGSVKVSSARAWRRCQVR